MLNAVRLLALLALLMAPLGALATPITTTESSEFLIIGNTTVESVIVSNFELGANQAPVPMAGLTLIEPIPANTVPVLAGITGDGEVAVTDPTGGFNVSDLDIFAATGVQCAGTAIDCNNDASNVTFNGLPFPANGLTAGVNFTDLLAELADAEMVIPGLAQTGTLDVSGSGGTISSGTTSISLSSGLNVIDIVTGGGVDFLLQNANLVIDGPADASAIFRVPNDANFLVSQSAILVGDSGIGLNNVLFHSDKLDNNAHFSLSNLLVNGVAFWDLSTAPSEIVMNNVQGCTQFIGNKVNAGQNVRLTRCAFAPVPEPATLLLLSSGLVGLVAWRRHRRK